MIARVLLRLALVAASIAWTAWGYLNTVGDPTRGAEIATAVLDDPEARHELAAPIVDQLRYIGDLPDEVLDEVTVAVSAALADPDISGQIISAFSSAHAQTLGVADDRTTEIDVNAISLALHRRLDEFAPEVAERIPNDIQLTVELPVYQIPYAAEFRSSANSAVRWTAIGAAAAAGAAFALGSRRKVLQRAGIWAVVSGATAIIATRVWVFGATRLVRSLDRTVETGIETATRPVVEAAWILVCAGIPAIVISLFLSRPLADVSAERAEATVADPTIAAAAAAAAAAATAAATATTAAAGGTSTAQPPPVTPRTTPRHDAAPSEPTGATGGSGFWTGYDIDDVHAARIRRQAATAAAQPVELGWAVDSRGSVERTEVRPG